MRPLCSPVGAVGAGVRLLPSVCPDVGVEVDTLGGAVRAVRAGIGAFTSVCAKVGVEVVAAVARVRTHWAGVSLVHPRGLQGEAPISFYSSLSQWYFISHYDWWGDRGCFSITNT